MAQIFRPPLFVRPPNRWPAAAISSFGDTRSGSLILVKPPGQSMVEPVRFRASITVSVRAQDWLSPSSQLLYLTSTPLSRPLVDPVRFRARPLAPYLQQQGGSNNLLFATQQAPFSVPVAVNPRGPVSTVALNAQMGVQPSLLPTLQVPPFATQLVDPVRFVARYRDLSNIQQGSPLIYYRLWIPEDPGAATWSNQSPGTSTWTVQSATGTWAKANP